MYEDELRLYVGKDSFHLRLLDEPVATSMHLYPHQELHIIKIFIYPRDSMAMRQEEESEITDGRMN